MANVLSSGSVEVNLHEMVRLGGWPPCKVLISSLHFCQKIIIKAPASDLGLQISSFKNFCGRFNKKPLFVHKAKFVYLVYVYNVHKLLVKNFDLKAHIVYPFEKAHGKKRQF